jgi:CHAT domain-containing protein
VLADPDYDLGRDAAEAEARRLLDGREGGLRGPGAVSAALGNVRWPRLPGTAAEGKAVATRLAAYAGREPAVRTGKDALESAVKRASRPRVLVFCTHAFFVEGPSAAGPAPFDRGERGLKLVAVNEARPEKPAPPPENPLLRCGLVLAGANSRPGDAAGRALDDGLLTGLEIVGLDLRGTELVVLSACESGVGVVRTGEGVAGLRQAFQLAGAQSVLATLWRIPDRETAQLMEAFFDRVAAGEGKAAALRGAQLDWIKQRRGRAGAAHPFFWAAFTLTGS